MAAGDYTLRVGMLGGEPGDANFTLSKPLPTESDDKVKKSDDKKADDKKASDKSDDKKSDDKSSESSAKKDDR